MVELCHNSSNDGMHSTYLAFGPSKLQVSIRASEDSQFMYTRGTGFHKCSLITQFGLPRGGTDESYRTASTSHVVVDQTVAILHPLVKIAKGHLSRTRINASSRGDSGRTSVAPTHKRLHAALILTRSTLLPAPCFHLLAADQNKHHTFADCSASRFVLNPLLLLPPTVFIELVRFSTRLQTRRGMHAGGVTRTRTFGAGKHAYPGRFSAAVEAQPVLVKLLQTIDSKSRDGQERPQDGVWSEHPASEEWSRDYAPQPATLSEVKLVSSIGIGLGVGARANRRPSGEMLHFAPQPSQDVKLAAPSNR
ncbi:hypothetical protein MBM_05162 [Drepanopeziza brunnea f. sp. 'multigermtubi' MB_m1]|uniref:Uncharacterized protein n=1 Tax=Marssonina brunnea f. sp. multigermtubi (strain MB_m1) TaxID=1072389 RepID=K1X7U3_MARBU|nr:uncharacterized protein MBM_05162 [Drepanopeziza brunnea f. sp. 'multigermtubi' MB_m1]EKD16693.1 hypothetical protein MBM_05162 [Drepanopeziza brunnea f. sp. 'multigermtubi' MB_m1]